MLVHEGHRTVRKFFTSANAGSYDSLARLATFGRDSAWKSKIIEAVGGRDHVLELACGTGILSLMLTKEGKSFVGIDLTLEYLTASKIKLHGAVAQGTAEVLPYRSESFDAITSSYLAKYVDLQSVISECWRVLRPGGVLVFHDFAYPKGIVRRLWNAHFAVLRLVGRLVTPWRTVLDQLDNVIRNSDWTNQITNALHNEGFRNVSCKYYTAGTVAIVYAEKP